MMVSVDLRLGDCLEILPTLAAGNVDAIITDLPYGTTACSWDTIIPFEPMWAQVKRLLNPRGVFVTTASQPFTSALVMSNLDWFRYNWIWRKGRPTGYLDAKRRPLNDIEDICVFSKNGHNYNPQMQEGKPNHVKDGAFHKGKKAAIYSEYKDAIQHKTFTKYPRRVIEFPLTGVTSTLHPTQKDIRLYEYLIRTYTNEGDTVLDFVMGSGTTGVACVQTGRNFIGIEIDPTYYAIAEKRIAQAQMQLVMDL